MDMYSIKTEILGFYLQ